MQHTPKTRRRRHRQDRHRRIAETKRARSSLLGKGNGQGVGRPLRTCCARSFGDVENDFTPKYPHQRNRSAFKELTTIAQVGGILLAPP
jgi:hypothetical protein